MTATAIAFDALMEPVAARLLGEPNHRLSKPPKNVRYGTHGSLSINNHATAEQLGLRQKFACESSIYAE
jgi:hypothetical protein